jgi:N-acetylmuramoyl-L-alanine amidase
LEVTILRRLKKKYKFIYSASILFLIPVIILSLHLRKNTVSLAEGKNAENHQLNIDNNVPTEQSTLASEFETSTQTLNPVQTPTATSAPITTPSTPVTVEKKIALGNNAGALQKKAQYTIIIDPGHGGPDPGSSGKKGTEEKKITLAVALKLGPILEKSGYKVIYTRKTDNIQWSGQKEELLERAAIANNAKADLFVSIHTNSSNLSNINGTETYYNILSNNGKKAAQYIQNEVIKQVKLKDRGIKTEDYSVLRNVSAPSVLIELAYISTPSEENILNDSSYQNKFAQGIASGVNKYFGK